MPILKPEQKALLELEQILNEMIQTPHGRRTFLLSVPLLMTACSSAPKHRQREGDNSGQVTSLTPQDERKLTEEALKEMRKDYPPVRDPQLQNYISQVGFKIARANNLEGNPYNYNFTIVDVPYVNAFALPAGTVFVTAPLIAMADTEAELAGVIGHEIGHIQARHTAERMDKAKREQGKTWLYGAAGGILGGLLGYGAGKLACRDNDSQCRAKALQLGAIAGASGGLLVQKYKFMANSREDEMEADRIGFRTSVKAGYDKDKVGLFYEKLLAMEQKAKKPSNKLLASVTDALSTHPPSKERVQQMNEMAAQQPRSSKAITSTTTYDKVREKCRELTEKAQARAGDKKA